MPQTIQNSAQAQQKKLYEAPEVTVLADVAETEAGASGLTDSGIFS
jgi:hypothetical protein